MLIRVGLMPGAPLSWIARAAREVRRGRPTIRLSVSPSWADLVSLRRIRDGEVDVAVVIGPVGDPTLTTTTLGVVPTAAFVAPQHPLADRRVVDLDVVLAEPTFRRPEGVDQTWRSHWLQDRARAGREPLFVDVVARTEEDALLAIATTRAVGVAPWSWASTAGLVRLSLDDGPAAPVQMVRPTGSQHPSVEAFCSALRFAASDEWRLTAAEARAAVLVSRGLTSKEIGKQLGLSPRTVDTQVASAVRRLGLRNRIELAARWREHLPRS